MMIDTLQNSSNIIRTAFGDSDISHNSTPDRPYHGTGQGSGASPAIWFAITIVLIEALLSENIGTFLTLVMSYKLLRIPAILLVDDTDFIVTGTTATEDAISIRLHSQRTLLLWSSLLHATGGSLCPEKCRWSLIDFKWIAGAPFYKSIRDEPASLVAYNSDRRLEVVKRIEPKSNVEILGVWMNAVGTDTKEYTRTTEGIDEWNGKMTDGKVFKKAASTALRTTIYRTVCYRLPATQFTPHQCQNITFKLHHKILSKMGINSRIANAYRFAPPSHNGLGLMNVRLEQFICHILEFTLHQNRDTLNGLAQRAKVELCHLYIGSQHNMWSLPYIRYQNLLPVCEIKFMLMECDYFKI